MTRRRPKVQPEPGEVSCAGCEGTGWENCGPQPGNRLLDLYRWCRECQGTGVLPACCCHPDRPARLDEQDRYVCESCWQDAEARESRFIAGI